MSDEIGGGNEGVSTVTIAAFSDPMQGLAWEMESVWQEIRARYGKAVRLRQVMRVLVDDVRRFMTPDERAAGEAGMRAYLQRLVAIYEEEERIHDMPIHMDDLQLFSLERTSSEPLCLAACAARVAAPERAEDYLFALRRATCEQCRPTTRRSELVAVAEETGIDAAAFEAALDGSEARALLDADMHLGDELGIRSLPSYVVTCGKKALLLQTFELADFERAIEQVSDGRMRPLEGKDPEGEPEEEPEQAAPLPTAKGNAR